MGLILVPILKSRPKNKKHCREASEVLAIRKSNLLKGPIEPDVALERAQFSLI